MTAAAWTDVIVAAVLVVLLVINSRLQRRAGRFESRAAGLQLDLDAARARILELQSGAPAGTQSGVPAGVPARVQSGVQSGVPAASRAVPDRWSPIARVAPDNQAPVVTPTA